MGTPIRNSKKPEGEESKKHLPSFSVADFAASPPFVIEWRTSRSPDVGSPAFTNSRGRRRTSMVKKVHQRPSSALETPHHSHSDTINTPDDPCERPLPVKKPKPVRLDTLLELKCKFQKRIKLKIIYR